MASTQVQATEASEQIQNMPAGTIPRADWTEDETQAMVNLRLEMDSRFQSQKRPRPLWEELSRRLGEMGYHKTADQCWVKFKNMRARRTLPEELQISTPNHGATFVVERPYNSKNNRISIGHTTGDMIIEDGQGGETLATATLNTAGNDTTPVSASHPSRLDNLALSQPPLFNHSNLGHHLFGSPVGGGSSLGGGAEAASGDVVKLLRKIAKAVRKESKKQRRMANKQNKLIQEYLTSAQENRRLLEILVENSKATYGLLQNTQCNNGHDKNRKENSNEIENAS
ncbi:uncharacterized protein VTP21DRAFT_3917 [Calcarisporiella thermophila]|uniref:uncharacterized protein n=1 Tax=Calcarisporiella thermophila TaxID=911321 RepID=UPI0037439C09